MKLYVGNLPYSVNDNVLRSTFEAYGAVESARVISDRETGQSKGFGFVEMADADAQKAMSALNGQELDGRTLRVNEARPQEPRARRRRRPQQLRRRLRPRALLAPAFPFLSGRETAEASPGRGLFFFVGVVKDAGRHSPRLTSLRRFPTVTPS